MLHGAFDYFRDKKRAAEDHAQEMLDIQENYLEDTEDMQDDHQDNMADSDLDYKRKREDIETEYRRDIQDLEADDWEGRADLEEEYQRDLADAATDYARDREDITSNFNDDMADLDQDRLDALDKEADAYKEQEQTIWQYLGAMLSDVLESLGLDLAAQALYHGALALAWSFIPPLFAGNPSAIGHGAAATNLGIASLAALGGGWALGGFEEGAVFEGPTMLPAHMVAEGGVSEAYLPLSPRVFGNIGQGIVDALSVPTATPALAGAGGFGDSIQVDMRGLYDGATINVRDDQDISRLAEETHSLWRSRMRGIGRNV